MPDEEFIQHEANNQLQEKANTVMGELIKTYSDELKNTITTEILGEFGSQINKERYIKDRLKLGLSEEITRDIFLTPKVYSASRFLGRRFNALLGNSIEEYINRHIERGTQVNIVDNGNLDYTVTPENLVDYTEITDMIERIYTGIKQQERERQQNEGGNSRLRRLINRQ